MPRRHSQRKRGRIRSMKKIDKTVLRETRYIAVLVLIFSVLMQAVFLIIRKWDITVLWGNILGGCAAVLNFFLMGLSVQAAVNADDKRAPNIIRMSQSLRLVMLFIIAALGVLLPVFHPLALLIPLFFPRLAITFKPLFDRQADDGNAEDISSSIPKNETEEISGMNEEQENPAERAEHDGSGETVSPK